MLHIRDNRTASLSNIEESVLTLNKTAAEIISFSNGIFTGNEILTNLGRKYHVENPFIHGAATEQMIGQLVENGGAVLLDEPDFRIINVTGNPKYATPVHVMVELLTKCNLRCAHCYRDAGPDGDQMMSLDQVKYIFSLLKENGVISVELTGGEISIHPNFYEIVELALEMFDLVALLTNGTKITNRLLTMLQPYKKKVAFNVSLDGSTAKVHEGLRGVKGSFEKTCNGIRAISEAGFFVRAAMSVYYKNIWDIEETLLLAKSLGASLFGYAHIDHFGRGESLNVKHDQEKLKLIMDNEKKLADQYSDFLTVLTEDEVRKNLKVPSCGMGWKSVVIDPAGYVRPCVMLSSGVMDMGNLFTQNYNEIFDSPLAYRLFRMVSPVKSDLCGSNCEQKEYCKGCALRGLDANSHGEKLCDWIEGNEFQEYTRTMQTTH